MFSSLDRGFRLPQARQIGLIRRSAKNSRRAHNSKSRFQFGGVIQGAGFLRSDHGAAMRGATLKKVAANDPNLTRGFHGADVSPPPVLAASDIRI